MLGSNVLPWCGYEARLVFFVLYLPRTLPSSSFPESVLTVGSWQSVSGFAFISCRQKWVACHITEQAELFCIDAQWWVSPGCLDHAPHPDLGRAYVRTHTFQNSLFPLCDMSVQQLCCLLWTCRAFSWKRKENATGESCLGLQLLVPGMVISREKQPLVQHRLPGPAARLCWSPGSGAEPDKCAALLGGWLS